MFHLASAVGKVPALSPWQTTSSALQPHLQSAAVHFDSRWRQLEGQGVIRGHDITGLGMLWFWLRLFAVYGFLIGPVQSLLKMKFR